MTRGATAILVALLLAHVRAHAEYRILSVSEAEPGEWEFEHAGTAVFDRRAGQRGANSYTVEIGTAATSWWRTQLELGFDRAAGDDQPTSLTGLAWENMFLLTPPGRGVVDLGFYVEYGQSLVSGQGRFNQIIFGPVIGKEIGRFAHTVNLFFTRQLGPGQNGQAFDFSYAWQSRWNIWAPLSPAIEIHGGTGITGGTPGVSRQQLLVGPVGVGTLPLRALGFGAAATLRYEIGWLFGMTPASPRGALRWRLELGVPF